MKHRYNCYPIRTTKCRAFKWLCIFACSSIFTIACDDAANDSLIYKPGGELALPEELSAGRSTVFLASSIAYDTQAYWVTDELDERATRGDLLYSTNHVSGDGYSGGLGPVFAGASCESCHRNAGRTRPTLFTSDHGSGATGFSSFLVYITNKNGGFFRQYGRVLHDQSIYGTKAEGKLSATYTEETFQFADGAEYKLQTPHYQITEWYADSIPPENLIITVRIPLRHVGMGQMMALDHIELEKLAAKSNYPEYGISGRLNYITERGVKQIGVSGNKAQHADLTVELGFSSDLGVTNDRFPEEVSQGQIQSPHGLTGIEISTKDMADVDLYMQTLGVPARRNVTDPTVKKGEEKFYEAKCHLCHTVTLHTRARGATVLDGTKLPWLGSQVIHPYSDYLLHDMGEGLADNYKSGLATGREWRTTPLWGVGLQQNVNGHTYFLHDGRARNLTEAIMWHGGEGAVSKELFRRMSKEDRTALLTFLNSL